VQGRSPLDDIEFHVCLDVWRIECALQSLLVALRGLGPAVDLQKGDTFLRLEESRLVVRTPQFHLDVRPVETGPCG